MHKDNIDLQKLMKSENVKQWQVADALGVSGNTLIRKLRYPLDQSEKKKITDAIQKIKEQ